MPHCPVTLQKRSMCDKICEVRDFCAGAFIFIQSFFSLAWFFISIHIIFKFE